MSSKFYCPKCYEEIPKLVNDGFCPRCKIRIGGQRKLSRDEQEIVEKREQEKIKAKRKLIREINRTLEENKRPDTAGFKKKLDKVKKLADQSANRRSPKLFKQYRDQVYIRRLIKSLKYNFSHMSSTVYWSVGQALSDIGLPAVKPLIQALKSKRYYVREGVVQALGMIGEKIAVKPIIEVLNDENMSVRESAVHALRDIGDSSAVMPLIEALNDENKQIREAVVTALGRIPDERAVEALINVFNDTNAIRWGAAIALGNIKDKRAVDPLIKALNGEWGKSIKSNSGTYKGGGGNFQEASAFALGKIGGKRATEALTRALKDNDIKVRNASKNVLEKLQ